MITEAGLNRWRHLAKRLRDIGESMNQHVPVVGKDDEFQMFAAEIDKIRTEMEAIADGKWKPSTD
jgi:hypothetical protein